jgi:multisubunit Na+/H+ antiporter MnhC subunit
MPLRDLDRTISSCDTRQNDPVLQTLIIALIFVLLGLTACATALILRAYWDHFVQVLYFDSKF